jgi:hypothetical protein
LRQPRLDARCDLGIGIADRHAEPDEGAGWQLQFRRDFLEMVAHCADAAGAQPEGLKRDKAILRREGGVRERDEKALGIVQARGWLLDADRQVAQPREIGDEDLNA